MKTEQRLAFDNWLEEKYPLVYKDSELHGVRDWVDFAYLCYLQGGIAKLVEIEERMT